MAQCLECGIMIGEPGTYTTCLDCALEGRSPEARRRAAAGLPPERVGPHYSELRVHDISVVPAESVPVELRFTVKKNQGVPPKTVSTPFKTRFERDDVI
jgi:hypothetical protein